MCSYSTGNETRDSFILRAIEQVRSAAKPTPLGVATVAHFLPKGFELDADELRGMLSTLELTNEVTFDDGDEHTGDVPFDAVSGAAVQPIRTRKIARVSESLTNFEAPRANADAQRHDDAPKTTGRPITAQQMQEVVNAAARRLEQARINVRIRTGELQGKRAALAKAIATWQAGQPTMTWEQNARAHVAASQAARAARVAAGGPETSAKARAFVQKRMQSGPNRGAYNEAQRARVGFTVPGSPAATAPRDFQADARARAGITKQA